MFTTPNLIITLMILVICVTAKFQNLDSCVKRNKEILSMAPLIPDLIQSTYADGEIWKSEVRKLVEEKGELSSTVRLVSLKEFQEKLIQMAEWLKQMGINKSQSTVFTQTLSESLHSSGKVLTMKSGEWVLANLMRLRNINPAYIVDLYKLPIYFKRYLQKIFKRSGGKFFLIDDGSYSGSQLQRMLSELKDQLSQEEQGQLITVYIAIPYISKLAREYIEESEFPFEIVFYPDSEEMPIDPGGGMSRCLFAFQYKVPDPVSVPGWFEDVLRLAAMNLYRLDLPPYKGYRVKKQDDSPPTKKRPFFSRWFSY